MMRKYLLFFAILGCALTACAASPEIETRPPFVRYSLIKPTDIRPQGWLRQFLKNQKTGLTGHIEAAGYPFNGCMWTGRYAGKTEGQAWWPYEQTGYYVDGCLLAGYLLDDTFLINKAKRQIEYVLKHQQTNGRLGPENLKGRWNLWPYAGFLRSFMTEFSVHRDPRIVPAMLRHYANYSGKDFADELDLNNAEELCWLYAATGEPALLAKAEEAYATFKSDRRYRNRDGRDIVFASDAPPNYHGVCYLEIAKIPAILYSYTGKEEYLKEAEHGIAQMEKYHMLASGVPSSSEHFAGQGERAGHETCNLATLPYTYGFLLRITGDPKWADKIEKAVFNAGIGAVTKDFKAHQYFSSPNQFVVTTNSCHLGYHPARFMFAPGHDTECCTGNLNRFMPYYAEQLWLKSADGGLVAALFGASEVTTVVGESQAPVRIVERTKYPFEETIEFEIKTKKTARFPLRLRIPAWAKSPALAINGKPQTEKATPGTFATILRDFKNGDKITLTLPMEIHLSDWPNQGVAIERGPLVFSYPIAAQTNIVKEYKKSTPQFPAMELRPASDWNYSLDLNDARDIQVIRKENNQFPWSVSSAPVSLKVPAKKLKNWKLIELHDAEHHCTVLQTPAFPEKRELEDKAESIELVPYGCTLLRLTVFPKAR